MGATVDELERLAALHRSGVLTDDEFAAQKARVLGGGPSPVVAAPMMAGGATAATPPQLSKIWQRRFAFFTEHGSPLSPSGAQALQKLPFMTGSSIRFNVWGFLFGPIYFLVLGIWKRAISIFALVIVVALVMEKVAGSSADPLIGIISSVFCAMTVNFARYIQVTEGRDEWNPFADLFTSRIPAQGG